MEQRNLFFGVMQITQLQKLLLVKVKTKKIKKLHQFVYLIVVIMEFWDIKMDKFKNLHYKVDLTEEHLK